VHVRDDFDTRMRLLLAVALLSIIVGGSIDLALDRPTDWLALHPIFELLMVAGALVMATTLWLGWWRAEHSVAALRASLAARQAERDQWKASAQTALDGLGRAIDAQFRAWRLTPTEREVALMLLQGHGHKEIAARTDRSERTVRQHAGVVYEKSGLGGRAELAAFFLHDLMLPGEPRDVPPAPEPDALPHVERHGTARTGGPRRRAGAGPSCTPAPRRLTSGAGGETPSSVSPWKHPGSCDTGRGVALAAARDRHGDAQHDQEHADDAAERVPAQAAEHARA
jgi:DNA-binding CsgD family transcriptional regulator